MSLQETIEKIWDNRDLLQDKENQEIIRDVIMQLDLGELRVAEPTENGWQVNEWVKKSCGNVFPYSEDDNYRGWSFFNSMIKSR